MTGSLAASLSNQAAVASSPSERIIAATNERKDPLVGGSSTLPVQRGSTTSSKLPRQVLVPDLFAVVDDDPAPPGDGDPVALGVGEAGVDPGHHLVGQRLEQPFERHETQGPRVLGQEHVGRGAIPLGEDRGGQFRALPVTDLQLDPGLLGEPIEQRADQVLAPTRVHHEGTVRRPGATSAEETEPRRPQRGSPWTLIKPSPVRIR